MPTEAIEIIPRSSFIDDLLAPFEECIGPDLPGYRNHVLRVLTYTRHFLHGDDTHRQAIEVALAFHDIGLWTAGALAYLDPSEEVALRVNRERGLGIDPDFLVALIHWHHKLTPYRGAWAREVNALRRADWVDASQGLFRKGLARSQIAAVEAALPSLGFHEALQRLAGDLSGGRRLQGLFRVVARGLPALAAPLRPPASGHGAGGSRATAPRPA